MINVKDIKSLKNQSLYPTSNEKYVLTKRSERIVRSPEYKILGFLHNFCYSFSNYYVTRSNLDGVILSKAYIGDIEYGAFNENVDFFYLYKNKKFYKVDKNLNIEWEVETDDYIRNITEDSNGHAFIVYKNSRIIHEYLPDSSRLRSFRDSDDVTNKTRIFKTFVNKGRTEMYTIGSIFVKTDKPFVSSTKQSLLITEEGKFLMDEKDNPIIISVLVNQINTDYMAQYAETFIDTYDLITGLRTSHKILSKDYSVKSTDPYYNFDNIYVNGNNIYIYSNEYIQKVNKSMVNIWKHYFAYNAATKRYNQLGHIEYDDNDYSESLYFLEDLYETDGHAFGKLTTKGNLIWKIGFDKSIVDSKFSFGIYKGNMFTSHKSIINVVDNYYLAVNNYNTVFETRDNKLIKIIRNNEDEIYSNEYYDSYTLLADVIKNTVPEYISRPLYIRGNEPLLNEDGEPILVDEYNTHYLDPENFDTFVLKGLEVRNTPYPNGAIVTKQNGYIIQTLKKKIISTLKAVKPPKINEPSSAIAIGQAKIGLAKMGGSTENAVKDIIYFAGIGIGRIGKAKILKDYIPPEEHFEYTFNLCGDRHIFRNNIITKKKGLTILTKRTGASIMKKVKNYYKFIFRRFQDLDIVLEFIKQSGILNTKLPKFADKLIHHTRHMIEDMQTAHVPVSYDLKAQKMFSYYFDSWEMPIRTLKTQVYLCHNLPWMRKRDSDSIFIDSMANVINSEIMKPFIMFIDGKAIKWSNMTIVHNWEYDYIIISNIDHDISYKYEVNSILLPCLIRYGEDENVLPIECEKFLFDKNGRYVNNPEADGIRVEIIDPNISGNTYKYDINTNYIQLEADYNQISSDKNILIFEGNKFDPTNIDYLTYHGKNIYTYSKDTFAYMKTFYYIKANDTKNILNKLPHQTQVDKDIQTNIFDDNSNGYLDNFRNNDFDYSYNKKYSYNENVSRAIEYIMGYDMSLLNKYYTDEANICCMCFNGKDILDRVNGNYLEMPRDRKYGLDDYVVVYKNGKLYERFREIEYKASMFKIPVNGSINESDTIEIVHYKHVENMSYPTRLTHMSPEEQKILGKIPAIDYAKLDFAQLYENNWYYSRITSDGLPVYDYKNYLTRHLRYGDLLIFGNNKSGSEKYDDFIKDDNYIQYPVKFVYRNNKDEYNRYQDTEIIIEDRYYKYKMLNFTSSRQFRQMYYNVFEEQSIFDLDQSFRFCQNKKQYLVFVNGKKLNFNEFDLLIPRMDKYTIYTIRALTDSNGNVILVNDKPLEVLNTEAEDIYTETDRMSIRTNIPLNQGDIIDILYVPDPYDEIILNNYIPNENGVVELDKDILQYPFSKDLFLIYMNGKKISNDLIEDISKNKIRIKSISDDDKVNMKNITICKYIIPDKVLKELYSYGDDWSDAIDKLNDSDFHKLFVDLKKLV